MRLIISEKNGPRQLPIHCSLTTVKRDLKFVWRNWEDSLNVTCENFISGVLCLNIYTWAFWMLEYWDFKTDLRVCSLQSTRSWAAETVPVRLGKCWSRLLAENTGHGERVWSSTTAAQGQNCKTAEHVCSFIISSRKAVKTRIRI